MKENAIEDPSSEKLMLPPTFSLAKMYQTYIELVPNGISRSCIDSYFHALYKNTVNVSTKTDYCDTCFNYKYALNNARTTEEH